MKTKTKFDIRPIHLFMLSIIRILIGWHFLYEGITKIMAGNWSSAPYLAGSKWVFAPVFSLDGRKHRYYCSCRFS